MRLAVVFLIALPLHVAAPSVAQETTGQRAADHGQRVEEPLTLRAAVDEALSRNPAIAASAARARAAEARLGEARAMRLPRVDATESAMRSNNPVFVFGSLLEQGRFAPQHFDPAFLNDPDPLSNVRLALNVRYTLFDRRQRSGATRQARNGVAMASDALEETRQRIRFEAISRFLGILVAEERVSLASQAVRAAEADARAMRDKFELGLLVEADALAAEVQLAAFRQQEIEAAGDLAVARASLNLALGRSVIAPLAIADAMPDVAPRELALDDAIARGVEARGAVRIAENAARNAAVDLRTARGARLPRVDTFASWGASGSSIAGGDPDRTIGVVIGIDLFDRARDSRLVGARAGVDAARAEEQSARDAVTMEIVSAFHRAHAARQRLDVAARAVAQADAAARIVRDRYEQGLTTITEQLRAQTALVRARLDQLGARFDLAIGESELLRATGGLHDVEAFR